MVFMALHAIINPVLSCIIMVLLQILKTFRYIISVKHLSHYSALYYSFD